MSLKSIFITLLMTFLITGCQQRIINQAINNQSSTSNEVDVVDVKEVVTGDKTESSSSSPDIDLENMPEPEVNESVICVLRGIKIRDAQGFDQNGVNRLLIETKLLNDNTEFRCA